MSSPIHWQEFIQTDPDVVMGKPVFKGTRITVEFVLERLGQGASETDLLEEVIGLKPEHLRAAHAYAAAVLRRDELVYSA